MLFFRSFKNVLSQKTHRLIFLFGLCGLLFGMMIGTVPTSVPQLILLGNWILEMDFARKWRQLRSNRLFWCLVSVFLIHALGLIYTGDLHKGWDDVRTKLPLLFLPVLLFTNKPLSLREFHLLLYCFMAGCIANTAWCFIYSFLLHRNEVGRNASRFMSHIRLGLYLNMGIACCVYFTGWTEKAGHRIGYIACGIYYLFSMYALGLISGLVNFLILCFVAVLVIVLLQKPLVKLLAILLLLSGVYLTFSYIGDIRDAQLNVKDASVNKQLLVSSSGRYYAHFDSAGPLENGYYILRNIQTEELQREWQRRFPDDGFTYPPDTHNLNRYEVLIRYLAGKGLTKDSAGVAALGQQDLDNIQNNVPNHLFPSWNFLRKRIYELVGEYDDFLNHRNVNGQSLTMRLYFWQAAAHVIVQHPVTGVGTGDVQAELNRAYAETGSPLNEEWRKRPHNQFLTVTVALGVIGLCVFLFHLLFPVLFLRDYFHFLFWPFFLLALISFCLEDTLETQAGLSFYAVFNTLLVSLAWSRKEDTMKPV